MLNLEYKFPFVFSVYGRRLFQINYTPLVQVFTAFEDSPDLSKGNMIIEKVMYKLYNLMMSEFNTIAIMLECISNQYRRLQCKKHIIDIAGHEDSDRSIKNSSFSYRVLEENFAE